MGINAETRLSVTFVLARHLALSEAGFATGVTQDLQIVLERRRLVV